MPVFVPSFRGVSNGSEKTKGTFNEFRVEDVSNKSNNFVTTVRNKIFTSMSSSSATVETRFTKINQTRKIMLRKNGETSIHVPNSSINNGSIGSIKNSSVYFLLPNNSNLITTSDSLLTVFNNFSSFYQNLESQNRPNFPFPSANTPQKIFLYKTLFSPYIYEPNIIIAFTRRIFDFVTNIMRPFSMT